MISTLQKRRPITPLKIFKAINRETLFYLIFGVLTTLVDWVSYGVFRFFSLDIAPATALAWGTAVMFSFITNKIFVFESRDWHPVRVLRELAQFTAARLLTGFLTVFGMEVLTKGCHVNELAAKGLLAVVVIVVNYLISKRLIFKKGSGYEGESK